MEVPYEREEEEVIGEHLQTRRRTSQSQHPKNSNNSSASSENSSITSESSNSSFEYSVSMDTNNNITSTSNNTTITNGEKLNNGRSVVQEEADKVLSEVNEQVANIEEPNAAQNEDTNGFSVEQNGVGVVKNCLPVSNGGDKETDIESSFSKSPEPGVGLKYVLDESSHGVIVAPPEISNAENIVNKTLDLNGQNEIAETGQSQEIELEEEDEYDVEGVIQKQETYDFYCPNCKECITKRVILKRRKRKFNEISIDVKDPDTDKRVPETRPSPDARFDAISCFSCFSIFVPKGDGFLCWRFKPKPDVTMQSVDPSFGSIDHAEQQKDDGTGRVFPLWILTCCQPYHEEKRVRTPESKPSLTSEEGFATHDGVLSPPTSLDTPVPPKSQPSLILPDHELPPSRGPHEETLLPPKSEQDVTPDKGIKVSTLERESLPSDGTSKLPIPPEPDTPLVHKPLIPIRPGDETISSLEPKHPIPPDEGTNIPLWFLTCCQPASEEQKQKHPERPGTLVLPSDKQPLVTPEEGTSVSSDKPLVTPEGGTNVSSDKPLVTPEEGRAFPLWFLTCCQPSMDSSKPKPAMKPDTPVHPKEESPSASEPWSPLLPKPLPELPPIKHHDGFQSSSEPPPPGTPPKEYVIVPIPVNPQRSDEPFNSSETGTSTNLEESLLPRPDDTRPGVSGLDIIKAIVYGGLLECITGLSVITSAAGGDATTLNIVALGLANVCAGLLLLLHNLRTLKRGHATERYEDELGRPGHFLLHAVVAVTSYLVFGLMSPIIYGFAFRESDNKDYKLATLAAASLVCITFLSIGKAYVRSPPKAYMQTVFYYISMGFMVSGAGYIAGDLINMLLKKLGVFDSRAPVAMALLDTVKGAWSY